MRFERFLEYISDHFFTLHFSSHICKLTLTQNKYSKWASSKYLKTSLRSEEIFSVFSLIGGVADQPPLAHQSFRLLPMIPSYQDKTISVFKPENQCFCCMLIKNCSLYYILHKYRRNEQIQSYWWSSRIVYMDSFEREQVNLVLRSYLLSNDHSWVWLG